MSDRVLTMEQLGDAIVVLTLNRPERRNALSIALMDALCETLEAFASQEQFRVVILRGAAPGFAPAWISTKRRKPNCPNAARCASPGRFKLSATSRR